MKNIGQNISQLFHSLVLFALVFSSLPQLKAESEQIKHFSDYPEVPSIWLAASEVTISNAHIQNYRSISEVEVEILKPNLSKLKEGEHWATIDPEKLALETRSIILERKNTKRKLKEFKESQNKDQEQADQNLYKLREEKRLLLITMNQSSIPANLKGKASKAVKGIDAKIKKIEESISEKNVVEAYADEEEALALTLERREKEFEKLHKKSVLKAAFNGVLEYNAKPDEDDLIWVEGGELYATIKDNSSFEIIIADKNPVFKRANYEKMRVTLTTGVTGQLIVAYFKESRTIDYNGAFREVLVFEVSKGSVRFAEPILGQTRIGRIHMSLPENCFQVSKHDIALNNTDVLDAEGWRGLVTSIWPDAKVEAIGQKSISVTHKNENQDQ